jgi:uncharacterized membrane protein
MFTTANGLTGQANLKGHIAGRPVRLTAVLGVLLVTSVLVNAAIILADAGIRERAPVTQLAR